MKVLFVYSIDHALSPQRPLRAMDEIQMGVSYISAVLKQHGHETRLVVLSRLRNDSARLLEQTIGAFQPRVICFTAVSTQYEFVAGLAGRVRHQHPDTYLLAGGAHVSLNPATVAQGLFDAVCIGEGEFPTLELVNSLQSCVTPTRIPNLWLTRGTTLERNEPREFLEDLGDLPFPDRQMWTEWIEPRTDMRYSLLLGRGCPFSCTYCSNHALRKLARGTYVRYRPPGNIVAEIEDLAASHATLREIYLEVETIGTRRDWILDLCTRLTDLNGRRSEPIRYGVNLRVTPNCDFDDVFAAMRRANFAFVNIGLESGSERVRREVLRRNYSNEDVLRTVAQARAHGLQVSLLNMIGLPGETIADAEMTVQMNRACRPDWHGTSIFYPYPGTELYAECESRGLLNHRCASAVIERTRSVLDLPEFPRKEIEKRYVWFDYDVYKGVRPLSRILRNVLAAKVRSSPRLIGLVQRMRSAARAVHAWVS